MGEVTAEYMDVFSNPVALQYLKPLDYEIHPCISSCGPAAGSSNPLPADLVPIEALGNDDSFFIFMRFFEIGLNDKAKALQ